MMDTLVQAQADQAARQATAVAPAALSGGTIPRFASPDKAAEAARDFESFFIGQMLQPMFSGLSTDPPFGGGHAESTWRSLLVQEYGNEIARNGGIGVSDAVMRTILAAQES